MKDVFKQIGVLAAMLALDRFAKTGGLKGLADDDGTDFGSDLPTDVDVPYTYGAPYVDPSQAYGQYGYQQPYQQPYSPYGGQSSYQYPYTYPGYPSSSPYSSGYPGNSYNPYSGVSYPTYQAPTNPYSPYPTPLTTYPPVSTGYPTYNPYSGSYPTSIYPSSSTQITNVAEQQKDAYITQGVQQGILQVTYCGQSVAGQSQYHNCTFSWTNSKGVQKRGNFATAANVMKRYISTGRIQ